MSSASPSLSPYPNSSSQPPALVFNDLMVEEFLRLRFEKFLSSFEGSKSNAQRKATKKKLLLR
jgi:hypothetical protein